MRKAKVLMVLGVAVFCVATIAQSKPVHENVKVSHKKNNAVPKRKITEKDIAECTRLINKAEQQETVVVPIPHSDNTKIAERPYKPADVQLFASDDPKAIAHLTGKTTELVAAHPPVIKPIATTTQSNLTPSATKPITKSTVTPTIPKEVKPPIKPVDSHQVATPKAVAVSTNNPTDYVTPHAAKQRVSAIPVTVNEPIKQVGKIKTVAIPTSKPPKPSPAPKVIKPTVKKVPVAPSKPHIELSAPSKSSVTEKNNTKLINKKKQSVFSTPRAEAKK